MAGSWRILVGVVAMSLGVASAAQAQGCGWYPAPAIAYYYAMPVYYYYPRVIAVPDALPSTREPGLHKSASERAPLIISTRAQADGAAAAPTKERVKIGFWNLSGRDITLTLEGKTRTLAKNRSLTLELEREFSWQVDRLPGRIERVPDGQAAHEVVIRE